MYVRPKDGNPSESICRTDLRVVNDLDCSDGTRRSEGCVLPGIHAEDATGFVGMGWNTDAAMALNDRSHIGDGLVGGFVTVSASAFVLAENQHLVDNFSFTRWVEDSEDVGTAACRDLDAREDHELRKLRVVSTQLF
jgi:hypothetical protein